MLHRSFLARGRMRRAYIPKHWGLPHYLGVGPRQSVSAQDAPARPAILDVFLS